MPELLHHRNPHFKAAIEALVEAADYRQYVEFQADELLDAALPYLRKMIQSERDEEDVEG